MSEVDNDQTGHSNDKALEPSESNDKATEPSEPKPGGGEKRKRKGFQVSFADSFKHDSHPAHPVVGFCTWTFMLFVWWQVFGPWFLPVGFYFVYLVLLIPPWILGQTERQIRKQEEVSAFVRHPSPLLPL
jgi:hypothetical protein